MGLRINTNVLSLTAQRNLVSTSRALGKALERLASGSRINRAGDDAAGLAISEGLNSQVRGVRVAIRNANDAIGFLNTAEGALSELTNISQRLRELSIQAANGTLGDIDRGYLNNEATQLLAEFSRIATQTDFNGVKLLNGTFTTTDLQVGVNKGETISFSIGDARSTALGALASISGTQHYLGTAATAITINGVSIASPSAGDDTVSYITSARGYSAIAIAAAINNQKSLTGVTATVLSNVVQLNDLSLADFTGTLNTGDFVINGTSITASSGVTTVNDLIQKINDKSSSTGVKARLQANSTDDIELYATDGRNISISTAGSTVSSAGNITTAFWAVFYNSSNFVSASVAGTNLSSAFTVAWSAMVITTSAAASANTYGTFTAGFSRTYTGAIKLDSASAITFAASGYSATLGKGFSTTSVTVDTSVALSSVSVASQLAAQDSLLKVDATLSQLNSLRAKLGAVQNRLESTSNNLSITLENISAAKSQIRDTDIAQETAELTRAQILQQAGVAVLGQANTSSQVALSLLKF